MKIDNYLRSAVNGIVAENVKAKAHRNCFGLTKFFYDQSDGKLDLQYIENITNIIYVQPVGLPTWKSICLHSVQSAESDIPNEVLESNMQLMIPSYLFLDKAFEGILDITQWTRGEDFFHRLNENEKLNLKEFKF